MVSHALLSEADARARVLAAVAPLPAERVPLLAAVGRFLARELLASVALPGFDNSAMDGYALAARGEGGGEYAAGEVFQVIGEQPAGRARGLRLRPGSAEAARIFTGAPLPEGAGAVVMQEEVDAAEKGEAGLPKNGPEARRIVLRGAVATGEFIRRAGGDVCRGQRLLGAGDRLTPAALALAASQGLAEIEVGRMPRVAVLTTGDELRLPGDGGAATLAPGELYESNGVMLAALAGELVGPGNVTPLPHAPDEIAALDRELRRGLGGEFDALIVAGGVSVGERDLVKARLAAAGARLDLWRVAVKPGKPFAYGHGPAADPDAGGSESRGPTHVFGLPGNPVSAFVTFLLFVRPALLKLAGASAAELEMRTVRATAGAPLENRGDRPHYLRGNLDEASVFLPSGRQESHALGALAGTRALARLDAEARLPAGAALPVFLWSL